MKIEIWSDYTCPFCYLGETKLNQALAAFQTEEEVEISFKTFQLNPNAKREPDKDIHAMIAEKYGISYEMSKSNNDRIVAAAAEVGLSYDFDNLKPNHTLKAHQLAKLAELNGKGVQMTERLFKAYFEEGMDIGSEEALIALGETFGLSKEAILNAWESEEINDAVRGDLEKARDYQISSVPFFVMNDKIGVSGAQSKEHFLMALKEASK